MNAIFDKCHICNGKGRSLCLAAGKVICSACCGSKRGTGIMCGPDCAYSPFSVKGYDLWLKTDANLVYKILEYIIDTRGRSYFDEIMSGMLVKNGDGSPEQRGDAAASSALYYILFVECDKEDRTLAHRWKSAGWNGLTNDECVMMNCRMSCRATVIEIQKILDSQTMECVDLLDVQKGVFILIDRNTAARAVRYCRLFTWLTHYPNFSKSENSGIEIPDLIFEDFMDLVQRSFKKEFKKLPDFTMKDYLSKNFGTFCVSMFDLARDNQVAMLERMDMHQCKAIYRIEGKFDEIKSILDTYPDFQVRERSPEEKPLDGAYYYLWLRLGESKSLEKEMNSSFRHDDGGRGVGTIGNITLCPDRIIIEVFSKQKFKFAKKMVGKYFKKTVTLQNEIVVDMAKQLAGKIDNGEDRMEKIFSEEPEGHSEPIPVEIERKLARDFYKNHYKKFIDDQIPALNNLTPRQAAKVPVMRPRLIELMKQHIRSIEKQNRDKKLDFNIDWMLDELKLTELK